MHRQGFTLIELLVEVLIIGVLVSVALPSYRFAIIKSKTMQYIPLLKTIREAQEIYHMVNGQYAVDLRDLDISLPGQCVLAYTGSSNKKLGNAFACGTDFFLDNSISTSGNVSSPLGTVHLEYCPGANGGWAQCRDKRHFLISMFYQFANSTDEAEKFRCESKTSFGKQMCRNLANVVDTIILN